MTDNKQVSGKRKEAIARATLRPGTGIIRINSMIVANYTPVYAKQKIMQPLNIAKEFCDVSKIDIRVTVSGGGFMGQAGAIANAIARGLVEYTGSEDLHATYLKADRTLIAGDHRQTEVHKPGQSSKGPRHQRQKSYR